MPARLAADTPQLISSPATAANIEYDGHAAFSCRPQYFFAVAVIYAATLAYHYAALPPINYAEMAMD